MAGKLITSIAISALLSSFAWIVVQLDYIIGVVLFVSAFLIPPILFRRYYTKRPRMLVPFFAVSFVLAVLLTPP